MSQHLIDRLKLDLKQKKFTTITNNSLLTSINGSNNSTSNGSTKGKGLISQKQHRLVTPPSSSSSSVYESEVFDRNERMGADFDEKDCLVIDVSGEDGYVGKR